MNPGVSHSLTPMTRRPAYKSPIDPLSQEDRGLINALVETRKSRRISQSRVAESMGVGQPVVARFEAADSNPKFSKIRHYAEALGVDIFWMIQQDPGGAGGGEVGLAGPGERVASRAERAPHLRRGGLHVAGVVA